MDGEQVCIWCSKSIDEDTPLVQNRKYCIHCEANLYRECIRCRRPFDHPRYFELNERRCNTCHKKYKVERSSRKKLKQRLEKGTQTVNHRSDSPNEEIPTKKLKGTIKTVSESRLDDAGENQPGKKRFIVGHILLDEAQLKNVTFL